MKKKIAQIRHCIQQQYETFEFFKSMPYTMLTKPELAFLHTLTRDVYQGEGKILDLGCFLGGSTYALASGLYENTLKNKENLIYSYDLFVWDKYMHDFVKEKSGFKIGDSFHEYFLEKLHPFSKSIQSFQGDFMQYPWGGEGIEICFIDIAKNPSLNDFVVHNFFSSLLPGCTVIQQDFQFPSGFWLHITMEYFKEYIELVDDLAYNSRIYVVTKKIPEDVVQEFAYKKLSYETKHELLLNHLKTIPEKTNSYAWLAGILNQGLFYFWENEKELARECFEKASTTFNGEKWHYDLFFNTVNQWTGWDYKSVQS